MTSLLNQSGLNFQNGNPLGRKVRALESDVDTLKKEMLLLKGGAPTATAVSAAAVASASAAAASSSVSAEIDALKREIAMLKMVGFGKGEKGDRGEKGDKGDKGDQGPMTYIAMPSNASMPMAAPAPAPVAASVV
jgi:hypothetical protein